MFIRKITSNFLTAIHDSFKEILLQYINLALTPKQIMENLPIFLSLNGRRKLIKNSAIHNIYLFFEL